MVKKRNGFKQKIRESLPESLIIVLKKHLCLTVFINAYENMLAVYINRENALKSDIRMFGLKEARKNSCIMRTIVSLHKFHVAEDIAKLD